MNALGFLFVLSLLADLFVLFLLVGSIRVYWVNAMMIAIAT